MTNLDLLLENSHPTVTLTKRELSLLRSLSNGDIGRNILLIDVFGWSTTFASKATYNDTRCVDMLVSRLKKKVNPLGIIINSKRGVGYSLHISN